MNTKLEKKELLQLLLEKKIISNIEGYDDLTNVQLEGLLENGMKLIEESINTDNANAQAIQQIKDELLEDKDEFVKNVAIENKRVKQQANTLTAALKVKIKELAKLLDEPFK